MQFHLWPRRVARDLQDAERRAEEVRRHSPDALFQEKKFDCETAGEAGQLTQAASPA